MSFVKTSSVKDARSKVKVHTEAKKGDVFRGYFSVPFAHITPVYAPYKGYQEG